MRARLVVSVAAALCWPIGLAAAPLTPGNILVTENNVVHEYTTSGSPIQHFQVPEVALSPQVTEEVRDVAVSRDGRVHVYSGTFEPKLGTLDPASSSWASMTAEEWTTVNNQTYGGIATFSGLFQTYVFVTDMTTSGEMPPAGVIRFDLTTDAVARFPTEDEPIDLTCGLDGALYVLLYDETTVAAYAPSTFEPLGTIVIGAECRAIAVDAAGRLFGAAFDGTLYRFDSTGAVEATLQTSAYNLADIDIDESGRIVAGSTTGVVIRADDTLAGMTSFQLQNQLPVFVAFTDPEVPGCPEPGPCDDGDPCTADDACVDGACSGMPVDCGAGGGDATGGNDSSSGSGWSSDLDDDRDDGCGCRLTAQPSGSGWSLLVLLLLSARGRGRQIGGYVKAPRAPAQRWISSRRTVAKGASSPRRMPTRASATSGPASSRTTK